MIGRRARLGRAESRARPRVHPSRHVRAMCGQTGVARPRPIRDGGTVPDDIVTGAIYCANCGTLRPLARACIIWESRWKIVRTARRPRSFSIGRARARLRGRCFTLKYLRAGLSISRETSAAMNYLSHGPINLTGRLVCPPRSGKWKIREFN